MVSKPIATKKKKKKTKAASERELDSGTDSFMDSIIASSNADGLLDVKRGEIFGTDVGIPLPALSIRYLLQRKCLPLSRILVFSGEEGACKSALLYELMRWVLTYRGCVFFAENELKDAPMLRASMLNWDASMLRRIVKCETANMEEWQTFLVKNMKAARKAQTLKGGMGKRLPLLFCLDSLMSTDRRSAIEDVETTGHTSLGYAVLAQLATKFSRTLPKQLQHFPFLFVATNHLKPGMDVMGNAKSVTPGGKSMKFHESVELELKKGKDITREDTSGIPVTMMTAKNSLGASRKTITVELLWRTDMTDGKQYTYWDWHTATVMLLIEQITKHKYMEKRIKAACGIEINKEKRVAYSLKLGIPASAPVSYAEWSMKLEEHLDVLDELYKVLGILPCKSFEIGKDYDALQAEAEKSTREMTQTLYKTAKLIPLMDGVKPGSALQSIDVGHDADDDDADASDADDADDDADDAANEPTPAAVAIEGHDSLPPPPTPFGPTKVVAPPNFGKTFVNG